MRNLFLLTAPSLFVRSLFVLPLNAAVFALACSGQDLAEQPKSTNEPLGGSSAAPSSTGVSVTSSATAVAPTSAPPTTLAPSASTATTSPSAITSMTGDEETSDAQNPIPNASEDPIQSDVSPTATPTNSSMMSTEECTDNPDPEQTCQQRKEWGNCDQQWMIDAQYCNRTCGRCGGGEDMGTNTGPDGSGGNNTNTPNNDAKLPPVQNGQDGFTTRYWDCCKAHCGWSGNSNRPINSCDFTNNSMGGNHDAASACSGGSAHMCWNFVPKTNGANIAYAFAAHNGVGCGTCFQLDFTGASHSANGDPGSQSLQGKSLVVQVINTGGIEQGQFDLLVPGGGVGDFDACSNQWGLSDLGERYGGFFLKCQKDNGFDYAKSRQCAQDWCNRAFSDKPDLLEGCTWFVDWFGFADNPRMKYQQVPCPAELTAISGM